MKSVHFVVSTFIFFLFSASLLAQEQSIKIMDNALPAEPTAQLICPPIVNPVIHFTVSTCGTATVPLVPTFFAGAPSAATHSLLWSTGAQTYSISVSPTINTVYTCSLIELASGCPVEENVFPVNVLNTSTLSIFANTTTICQGESIKLYVANPFSFCIWSNGMLGTPIDISPGITTTYTVLAQSGYCSQTRSITISVLPSPTITTNIDSVTICKNESIQLVASGAPSYTWSNGSNAATITLVPTSYTNLYVKASHTLNACTLKKYMDIYVDNCTASIENSPQQKFSISYYNNSILYVAEDNTPITLSVLSLEGKLQYRFSTNGSNNFQMPELAPGIYFIQASTEQSLLATKRFVKF